MKKGKKKINAVEVTVEAKEKNFFIKFMHLGKGRHIVKACATKEEAIEFGKTQKPWMEGGNVKYPELVVEPGVLEVI